MTQCVQFAVGGQALPPMEHWMQVAERFRGSAIRCAVEALTGRSGVTVGALSSEQRSQIRALTGKDEHGRALKGHRHAYVFLWPDVSGLPQRMVVLQGKGPLPEEVREALARAAERPIRWGEEGEVQMVPLPDDLPLPEGLIGPAARWRSVTPFVPPRRRRRYRRPGVLRPGETPERQAARLVATLGFPAPLAVRNVGTGDVPRVEVHRTRNERTRDLAPDAQAGRHLEVVFPECVYGPLLIGESSHFGLGLFAAVEDADE